MKKTLFIAMAMSGLLFFSCNEKKDEKPTAQVETEENKDFDYSVEQFADIKVLRYQIPGWEKLSLKEQKLVYYLTQAGLEGRDIIWDQNYRHNLTIRKALENVYQNYEGDKSSTDWNNFETYLKRIWFSNGIHHHYASNKIKPEFSSDYLKQLLSDTNTTLEGEAFDVIFDDKDATKVDQSKGIDNVAKSAVNFYGADITTKDVENFYSKKQSPDPQKPLSFGLNSKLVKENGEVKELVYKSGGLYGEAIDRIIEWLEKGSRCS